MADGFQHQESQKADRGGISLAEEKRIARDLSPDIAWPTIILAVLLPVSFATLVYMGLADRLPLWLCMIALSIVSYMHYTLVHESVHGNIVARPRSLGWVHTLIGWVGSIGIGTGWPALLKTHVLHHSHTNTERDPDIEVKGTLFRLLGRWFRGNLTSLIPFFAVRYIAPDGYAKLQSLFTPSEIIQNSLVTVVTLVLLVVSLVTGHFLDWLCLWFVPTRIGILILNIFFQWMPHYPFDRTDRYRNTRISLWPAGTFLTLSQNLHLMHHLWPSVPFYNYGRLYRALRPVLIAHGSPIQGFMVQGDLGGDESGGRDCEGKAIA